MMASPSSQRPNDASAAPIAGTHRHARALDELVEMGMDLARRVHAGTVTPEGDAPTAEAIMNFDRVSRLVRRTINLARRLEVAPSVPHHQAARRSILRGVEDAIGSRVEACEAEYLRAELHERLDGEDIDQDIDNYRPVDAIIAEICRDLGIAATSGLHPAHRRTPADVAMLCARAAQRQGPPLNTG